MADLARCYQMANRAVGERSCGEQTTPVMIHQLSRSGVLDKLNRPGAAVLRRLVYLLYPASGLVLIAAAGGFARTVHLGPQPVVMHLGVAVTPTVTLDAAAPHHTIWVLGHSHAQSASFPSIQSC